MNDIEVFNKIKDIVSSVPGGLYKFQPPNDCFEGEWEEASAQKKAFLLIEELLLNLNVEKNNEKKQELDLNNLKTIEIPLCPIFYSITDENMFFEALKSVSKMVDIKGSGRSLLLYYNESLDIEEKEFLKGLFKRYQVPIPKEIGD